MSALHGPPSPAPKTPRVPFGFLPLTLGETPEMSFAAKARLATQNAGAWLMVFFGVFFVFLHTSQGNAGYVGLNCAFIATGALSLWLVAAGFRRTSLVTISLGSGVVFFVGALAFHNGMENYLLVVMAASLLLLDDSLSRVLIAGLNAAAYSYVRMNPVITLEEDSNPVRNGLNILLFLLLLAGLIEFFRILNSDYLASLEASNRKLDAANEAKERLFAVIGHDLRGPVGNLKASLDLLASGTLSQDDFESLVADLASDVDGTYSCLENLLAWSAVQRESIGPKPRDVPVLQTVRAALRSAEFAINRKGIKLEVDVADDLKVHADPYHVEAILRNLLSNSCKFTAQGGRLTLRGRSDAGKVTLEVRDTGVGIPAEKAARLFSDLEGVRSTPGTEAEQGLGLGVEICARFAKLNGGEIVAESEPGMGTTVRLTLPESGPEA